MYDEDNLPTGGITYKTIRGKKYAYYQWSENGKQRSRRVQDDEIEYLSSLINIRKQLKKQNQWLCETQVTYNYQYSCLVQTGIQLLNFVEPVKDYKKRECFQQLHDYIYGTVQDRVFVLYGLRRTGKTTLIRQLILEMNEVMKNQTAFIQVQSSTTLASINKDLKHLQSLGYRYIFIDEVTLMEDFIEGAALFSDIFASSGMKIVLSGTDSLGFILSQDEELFDRCVTCHTTFIPYREFENVLGIKGIDDYISYGGTMSISGHQYNQFANNQKVNEYIDSAIAHNIQHSLKNYQYGGHFRSLYSLYEAGELTDVIHRVVEDINHRFTCNVINARFQSHDLKLSAKNLRKDRENPTTILDDIDIQKDNDTLKQLLEILNIEERQVDYSEVHAREIEEYLVLFDLLEYVEVRSIQSRKGKTLPVVTQPGIRYMQAKSLIHSLMQDELFNSLSLKERKRIQKCILSEIKGRMMEEMILVETKLAYPHLEVFKLQFASGEFDMVVFDEENEWCKIYEIKYSKEVFPQQCTHLLNKQKCKDTAFHYGDILGKYVIYRGSTQTCQFNQEDIDYINVEDYLKSLIIKQ